MTHINSISCGQGAPSVYLIVMAGDGLFPADLVVTADTGWENDMLWSTGERTTAREYFDRVTKPLAEGYGMDAVFVRTQTKDKKDLPAIQDKQYLADDGKVVVDIPLFGLNRGRLMQACTEKWKKRGIRQELRRRGAKTATTNLGLTMDETHRMKKNDMLWESLAWPLIEARLYRATIFNRMNEIGVPYLLSTECDGCPHKNKIRWDRTAPAVIDELVEFEKRFDGQFFLTDKRIPLREALAQMDDGQISMFGEDACDSGYCFT